MVFNDASKNEHVLPTKSRIKVRKMKYVFADFSVAARVFCCILRGCTSIVADLRTRMYAAKMPITAQSLLDSGRFEMKDGS